MIKFKRLFSNSSNLDGSCNPDILSVINYRSRITDCEVNTVETFTKLNYLYIDLWLFSLKFTWNNKYTKEQEVAGGNPNLSSPFSSDN